MYIFVEKLIEYLFLKEVITLKLAEVFYLCRTQVSGVDVVFVAL